MKIYIRYLQLFTTDLLFSETTRNSDQISFNNQFPLRDRIIYIIV